MRVCVCECVYVVGRQGMCYEREPVCHAYVQRDTYILLCAHGVIVAGRGGGSLWQPAINPIADMANTISPQSAINTHWIYSRQRDAFEVTTTSSVAAGQVCVCVCVCVCTHPGTHTHTHTHTHGNT